MSWVWLLSNFFSIFMLEVFLGICFVVVMKDWFFVSYSLIFFIVYLFFSMNDSGEMLIKVIFMLLSLWLVIMMLMSVSQSLKTLDLLFIFIWLLFSLFVVFYVDSFILFYLGFEMSVIPILLILFGWGYQPDRLEAGFYMLIYTVLFSLPLLLKIFYLDNLVFSSGETSLSFFMFVMAFLVKLPMVGLHFWLPRAHVEAPVFGSMILAGVMLKLGGYGVFKLSLILGDFFFKNSKILIVFSLLGGALLSGICFVQSDLKLLIAYSSIVHMSIVLSGLLTMHNLGLSGSVMMMVGHGFCSSGLFCILGLTYNRSMTRSIIMNKGFISVIPICSFWWFMFCSSNLSFPPCLNLPGELFLFLSIIVYNNYMYMILGVFGVLSSLYSVYLFSFSQQSFSWSFYSFKSFSLFESLLMLLHWIPLNILILDLSIMNF
uniref:NADH-ubiquinone oxidoreductase chain 4 n=1 Tax=Cacopsylla burckhardti TaxID=2593410 RepID=A0A8K1SPV6_9HEMI|nr:NADH dehydrogenase subunit 4 [Cacopsylla burckhardti]UFP91886.1 NADH dehydrogenase subunit 4 [Cacopsylla burckhardti]WAK85089.1 NADH dehydrogenase subunit 4 [Cacopsylla burckhardti]